MEDEEPYLLQPTEDLSRVGIDSRSFNEKLYRLLSDREFTKAWGYQAAFKNRHLQVTGQQFEWAFNSIIAVVLGDSYEKPYGRSATDEYANVPLRLAGVYELPCEAPARRGTERPVGIVLLLDGTSGEVYGLNLHVEEVRWVPLENVRKHEEWHVMLVPPSEGPSMWGADQGRKVSFGGPLLTRDIVSEQEHGGNLFVCAKSTPCGEKLTGDKWLDSAWQLRIGQILYLSEEDWLPNSSNQEGTDFLTKCNAGDGSGVLLAIRRLDYIENGEERKVAMMYFALKYAPSHPLQNN